MSQRTQIPDYPSYSLIELYEVLSYIRADKYPASYDALLAEINRRPHDSLAELEDCYFAMNPERNPGLAQTLVDKITNFPLSPADAKQQEISKYSTGLRRCVAIFLDGFVFGIPLAIIFFIASKIFGDQVYDSAPLDIAANLVPIVYYVVMHGMLGQTVGKMLLSVKVVDRSESRDIGYKQATLREIGPIVFYLFGLVAFLMFRSEPPVDNPADSLAFKVLAAGAIAYFAWGVLEIVSMLTNKKRRAVHDFIARTVVVRVDATQ